MVPDDSVESIRILAPLRGVTVRCFRETFAAELAAAGFTEAITPFVTANPGYDPLQDRELRRDAFLETQCPAASQTAIRVTPQFIGKDPETLRHCLRRIKSAGYETADLNCGCPFPMVRNKGRGSGILKTPDVLRRMLDVGCAEMGSGKFSVKARLGVTRPDELLALMPLLNDYPIRFLTVHARTAVQMYEGSCDWKAFASVAAVARMPVVANGDIPLDAEKKFSIMIGRSFVRSLGADEAAPERLARYLAASEAELSGPGSVLGRMKELLSYWKDLPAWRRRWQVIKLARSLEEFRLAAGLADTDAGAAAASVRPRDVRAIVSLGSNVEPRRATIERALSLLGELPRTRLLKTSAIVETEPVDVPAAFRELKFLNCAAILETSLEPLDFSRRMHAIEDALGRVRTVRNGPRTIDIDLIDFNGVRMNAPELTLPHPRAKSRPFVTEPLRELDVMI